MDESEITVLAIAFIVMSALGGYAAFSSVQRGKEIQNLEFKLKMQKLENDISTDTMLDDLEYLLGLPAKIESSKDKSDG